MTNKTDKHGLPWLTNRRNEPDSQLWNSIQHHVCDCCGESELFEGPRAGACVNVLCLSCGQRYNLAIYMGHLLVIEITHPGPRFPDPGEEDLFEYEFYLPL